MKLLSTNVNPSPETHGHCTGDHEEGSEGGATAGEGGAADDAGAHQDDDDLYADIAPGFPQVDGVRLGSHSDLVPSWLAS